MSEMTQQEYLAFIRGRRRKMVDEHVRLVRLGEYGALRPQITPKQPTRVEVLHAAETLLEAGYTVEGLAVLRDIARGRRYV